jgi:serine protease Do
MGQAGQKFKRRLFQRRFNLIATMTLMLIVAIISGVTVGSLNLRNREKPRRSGRELSRNLSGNPQNATDNDRLLSTSLAETPSVVTIAKNAGPAVVGIRTTVQTSRERFFKEGKSSASEGSGIILSKDGYILTNYHVVAEADPKSDREGQRVSLEVFLPDKRQLGAKFIGGDQVNDLAVVKITGIDFKTAKLGNSEQLQVGALAVAIGNPLGMEFAGSVTTGVISALNRVVAVEDRVMKLIQTDAAINPGNSGGALVNAAGEVVGVNTIKIAVSGVEGLGFAIPINDAKPIVQQLIKYGYVKGRPWLGVSAREITRETADYYDLPVGILIIRVVPGGGADKAGIRRKDILVSMAGKRLATLQDLNEVKRRYKAGDTVEAIVVRGRKSLKLKVTFAEKK